MSILSPHNIRRFFESTDPAHIAKCLEQCNLLGGPGTFIEPQTLERLMAAQWERRSDCPGVKEPVVAYRATIGGNLGVVSLHELGDPDIELVLNNPEGTDSLEAIYVADRGFPVNYTTLLVGPDLNNNPSQSVVYSFQPGDPIKPSWIEIGRYDYESGNKITVREAERNNLMHVRVMMKP